MSVQENRADMIRTIRQTGRQPGHRITDADRPVIKSGVVGYLEWRKAKGLEPSSFWVDKVKDGLVSLGMKVKA